VVDALSVSVHCDSWSNVKVKIREREHDKHKILSGGQITGCDLKSLSKTYTLRERRKGGKRLATPRSSSLFSLHEVIDQVIFPVKQLCAIHKPSLGVLSPVNKIRIMKCEFGRAVDYVICGFGAEHE